MRPRNEAEGLKTKKGFFSLKLLSCVNVLWYYLALGLAFTSVLSLWPYNEADGLKRTKGFVSFKIYFCVNMLWTHDRI